MRHRVGAGDCQASSFLEHLESSGVPLRGVIANRVRLWPGGDLPQAIDATSDVDLDTLAEALRDSEGDDYPARDAARAAAGATRRSVAPDA